MISDIINFIKNVRSQTHVLRTTEGKLGQWYDLPERIEDALFTAIIDFVEVECSWMYNILEDSQPKSETEKIHLGLKYLHNSSLEDGFGRVNEIPLEIIAIYRYVKYQRNLLDEYSEEREKLDSLYLTKIIEIRKWLWT